MHKIKRMTQAPMTCLSCGRGNTPDDPHTLDDFWVLDLERDVNWGDPTYLCMYCCERIAVICEFFSQQDMKEAQDVIRVQGRKIHDLQSKLDTKSRRLDAISGAKRAEAQERKEASRASADAVAELKARRKKRPKSAA